MKIAIHNRRGSFSDHWINYCNHHNIDYKVVNAYDNDIVAQLKDCDAFMWHHHHENVKDILFAKQLIYALETKGILCFPNFHSTWHFDDKIGQKYLLEAIGAPLVPSYVFYSKKDALKWIHNTVFPKVFKLRGGASSKNVKLVRNSKEAIRVVKTAFGKGFSQNRINELLSEDFRKYKEGELSLKYIVKDIAAYYLKPDSFHKLRAPEKGYVYFQDFIPNNDHDIRVVVIGGKKAMAEKRYVRKGDFRASGSGRFEYGEVDERILKIAFEVSKQLQMQTIALDFIMDEGRPLIVEICYGFGTHGISNCGGFWTSDMIWHQVDKPDFYGWMIEELIQEINDKEVRL